MDKKTTNPLISGVVGALSGIVASLLFLQYVGSTQEISSQLANPPATDPVVAVVEHASPAVVSIIVSKDLPRIETYYYSPFEENPFLREFFGDEFNIQVPQRRENGTERTEVGGGTGFIVSEDGYIITNKHVVFDNDADYTVLMNDEKIYDAEVIARDPLNDIAILKIEAENLPTLTLGDSTSLKLGQPVIAIGNALGEFRNTVSTGIVSGLSRSVDAGGAGRIEHLSGLIQTDAAINSGNSGGPLLDRAGKVIGINTAVASRAENIGFAIPAQDFVATYESVKEHGRIIRAFLGVRYMMVSPEVVEQSNLEVDYGALVVRGSTEAELAVVPDSPADQAGIVEGDVILEINNEKITLDNQLAKIIGQYQPGDTVDVKIFRAGETKIIGVTLSELDELES